MPYFLLLAVLFCLPLRPACAQPEAPTPQQLPSQILADPPPAEAPPQPKAPPASPDVEPYHWKGLLLQSFAFDLLQNATRIITADQHDRHLLLNKPYWSDYWASLGQFNMRRWN